MALVALQFEPNEILVAGARKAGSRLQVNRLFSVATSGSDAEVASALKAALNQHGLSRSDAIIVVGRTDVELRELEVPPAPDKDIPDMVRFAARSQFSALNDSWGFDYAPVRGTESTQRLVFAAGLSPELKKQASTIAELAGLKIEQMVLRPYATIDLLQKHLSDDVDRLIIAPHGQQVEITIVEGATLLATRTVPVAVEPEANEFPPALLMEIRRTIASSRKALQGREIEQAIVIAEHDAAGFGEQLQTLGLTCQVVHPQSCVQLASGTKSDNSIVDYASLLGAIALESVGARPQIDFANPRRPIVEKTDYSRWLLYGGVAAAAILLAVGFGWWTLRQDALENDALREKLASLQAFNRGENGGEEVDQVLAEIKEIDEWKLADVNWMQELALISDRALTPDDAIVDLFDANVNTRLDSTPQVVLNSRLVDVKQEQGLINALRETAPGQTEDIEAEEQSRRYNAKIFGTSRPIEDDTYQFSSVFRVAVNREASEVLDEMDRRAKDFFQIGQPTGEEASRESEGVGNAAEENANADESLEDESSE